MLRKIYDIPNRYLLNRHNKFETKQKRIKIYIYLNSFMIRDKICIKVSFI